MSTNDDDSPMAIDSQCQDAGRSDLGPFPAVAAPFTAPMAFRPKRKEAEGLPPCLKVANPSRVEKGTTYISLPISKLPSQLALSNSPALPPYNNPQSCRKGKGYGPETERLLQIVLGRPPKRSTSTPQLNPANPTDLATTDDMSWNLTKSREIFLL